jgi:hypothetical protein
MYSLFSDNSSHPSPMPFAQYPDERTAPSIACAFMGPAAFVSTMAEDESIVINATEARRNESRRVRGTTASSSSR